MTLKQKYIDLCNLGISLNSDVKFDELMVLIMDKKTIELAKEFINLLGIKLKTKYFLATYMIIRFPNDIFANKYDSLEKDLIEKATKLLLEIYNIINDSDPSNLQQIANEYIITYDDWKKHDAIKLTHMLSNSSIELEKTKEYINNTNSFETDDKIQYNTEIEKLQMQLNHYISIINNSPIVDVRNIYTMVENAFWNKLKEELIQEPPKLDQIFILLKEIKMRMKSFSNEQELDQYIDIPYIEQQIKNNIFQIEDTINIMVFVISRLESINKPIDQNLINELKIQINEMIHEKEKYSEILPIFFKNIMKKIDCIEFEKENNKIN